MSESEIFMALLDLPDAAARAAYLDRACDGDPALRTKVEALFRSHETAGTFLGDPAVAPCDPTEAETQTSGDATQHADHMNPEGGLSFPATTSPSDSLGRIGRYELREVLGQGSFGTVWRAFDEDLQRVVAIKILAQELAATSPARKRFLREARTSAAVRHENVVQVYEVGEEPLPYLVMEFIPGETLQQRLDRVGPVEPAEVVRIGRQIAEGLAAAHAADLIHRDIKPGNILLESGKQKVKVTDFGLARAADDASISQSGIIAGTPMFMAPEQALGESIDQRADLFSLGSVLYQMAAGRPPFRATSTVGVLKRVAEHKPRPIREIIPETPPWLCDIIAKLHAKKRDDRFQSAREVADVLADCEAQLKVNSRLQDFSRVPSGNAANIVRWKWGVAAALLLPLLAFGMYSLTKPTRQSETAGPRANQPRIAPGADKRLGWQGWPADAPAPAVAPFGATAAKQHQEAWAKYLGVPVEYTNSIGMALVLIPPGEFTMGSPQDEIDALISSTNGPDWQRWFRFEGPQHSVTLTQAFCLGRYEVTQKQYQELMGSNPSHFSATGAGKDVMKDVDSGQHPVDSVNWFDAIEFCNKLSAKEQRPPYYLRDGETVTVLGGAGYRLPTEAEWEHACRAGTTTRWSFGGAEGDLGQHAWFGPNANNRTQRVGELPANPFGLHDQYGNVWEWCWDWRGEYTARAVTNPVGSASESGRGIRGGAYSDQVSGCRSAFRVDTNSTYRGDGGGFRICRGRDWYGPESRSPRSLGR
jgi:serine/threonine protein kinase/formylglycine-generating enzyme required for sulfatase activity